MITTGIALIHDDHGVNVKRRIIQKATELTCAAWRHASDHFSTHFLDPFAIIMITRTMTVDHARASLHAAVVPHHPL